jgi:hypothetical protein
MATSAQHDVPADRSELDKLLKHYPGGEYIADHVDDGPFYIVPVLSSNDPNWAAEAVLAAYPGTLVPMYVDDGSSERIRPVYVHPVPKFGHDMLHWHQTIDELELSERIAGPFDAMPGAAEIVKALPLWLGLDEELDFDTDLELSCALAQAVTVADPVAVLNLIGGLHLTPSDPGKDAEVLIVALSALSA